MSKLLFASTADTSKASDSNASSYSSVTTIDDDSFFSVAPGRLCLFGEHQDYLHFPVIALALPLYCRIHVTPTPSTSLLILHIPALQETREYDLSQSLPPAITSKSTTQRQIPQLPLEDDDDDDDSKVEVEEEHHKTSSSPDFALAALLDAIKDGWKFPHGAICISTTDLPMQAGCSSSSAFCVAWVQLLHRLSHMDASSLYIPLSPLELAQRAHHAEVLHFGAPGGNMDHVTSAFGGILRIGSSNDDNNNNKGGKYNNDTDKNNQQNNTFWHVQRLPSLYFYEDVNHTTDFQMNATVHAESNTSSYAGSRNSCSVWILVDSGEVKDTFGHLQRCKHDRFQLLQDRLGGNWDATVLSSSPSSAVNIGKIGISLTDTERQLLDATLVNRNTETMAAKLWMECSYETIDASGDYHLSHHHEKLAQLMNQHHSALRDGLHLSTTRLELLREAALQAGATGFKLVGSGGGGCGVAWCCIDHLSNQTHESHPVVDAVERALQQAGAKATWRITHASRGAWIQ